ncbi:MAG: hypothetical protein RLO50_15575 [Azospirillaceae bacterium]
MTRVAGSARPTPAGGIPCPECGSFIVIEVGAVLAGRAIPCVACGTTLTVDMARSAKAVEALGRWVDGTGQAKRFGQEPDEAGPPLVRRRGRRPRPARKR